jgi:ATP-dependent RNA helicase DOB1
MSANDLFSFLDAPADEDDAEIISQEGVESEHLNKDDLRSPALNSVLKRKAESPTLSRISDQNDDIHMDNVPLLEGYTSTKKPRMGSPNPVVLDDFETEAKREVAASAGLTGATTEAGSRLELRHQVDFFSVFFYIRVTNCIRFDIKS